MNLLPCFVVSSFTRFLALKRGRLEVENAFEPIKYDKKHDNLHIIAFNLSSIQQRDREREVRDVQKAPAHCEINCSSFRLGKCFLITFYSVCGGGD